MKTEQEIRARIAMHQQAVDEEDANGGAGNEDWMLAATSINELSWVVGE